jgi:hypothetical protein
MIAARAFDGDQAVAELVVVEGVTDLGDGGVEIGSVVGDYGGRNEEAAIEVGEEKLGAGLGTVEADDAEVLRADLLDAGMEYTAGLAYRDGNSAAGRTTSGTRGSHETSLQKHG